MCVVLGKQSCVVEGQLEHPGQQDHDGAGDVEAVLVPPPRGEPDAVVTVALPVVVISTGGAVCVLTGRYKSYTFFKTKLILKSKLH